MNILFIQTDQQRRDFVGCYGNSCIKTPHIDELAREGVLFENCFTTIPICAAARASILTGLRPVHHGIVRNLESGSVDGRDFLCRFPNFADELHQLGYSVHHIGKWHIGTDLRPEDCGLNGVYYPGYGYPGEVNNVHPHYEAYLSHLGHGPLTTTDRFCGKFPNGNDAGVFIARQDQAPEASIPYYLAEQTIAAINEQSKKKQDFFISINFWGPHAPYIIPEPYFSMYDDCVLPPWPNFEETFENKPAIQTDYLAYFGIQDFTWVEWQRMVRACYGYTTLIDDQIGRIIRVLMDLDLYHDTAIFFTSDHGGMVGAHRLCDKGPFLYDEILRVPFIARIPGHDAGGSHNGNWIYNYDLMPTFIDLAGGSSDSSLDASSLLPVLGGAVSRSPVMFAEFHGHQVPTSQRVVCTETHKYIFNGSHLDELYDLERDPYELSNRINDPGYAIVLRELKEQLLQYTRENGDLIERYYTRTRLGRIWKIEF